MGKNIGLHIRMNETPLEVAQKAMILGTPIFQFFLRNELQRYPCIHKSWLESFLALRRRLFSKIYVHASYWINLCNDKPLGLEILKKELRIAKRFECTHIILHPGSARQCKDHTCGMDYFIRSLNLVLKNEHDIVMVLENTAHGSYSVGSDIRDFGYIMQRIDYPEKLRFCIDTAHAYSYGYDITSRVEQDAFVELIDDMVGVERVELIHLNDTHELLGGNIDQHGIIGVGNIGADVLRSFMQRVEFKDSSIILELPVLPEDEEAALLQMVRDWSLTSHDIVSNQEKGEEICV